MGVRFACVTLKHPENRPMEPGVPARQTVSIVEAWEIDPPAGVRPAHWRLLTSHRVETFEQARWITQLYRRRWVIEQVFRTIKTQGFDIENVSVEPASTGLAGLCGRGVRPSRRRDRILWKTGPGGHVARVVSIPGHPTRIWHRWKCVNRVGQGGGNGI